MSGVRWEQMPPGSKEAVARGCLCPQFDNANGLGAYYGFRPGMFWVDAQCPLHGGLPGTGAGVTPENAPSREGDAAPGPDYTNGCAKCGKRTCDESCCDVCSDPQCPHNNQPL